jgi:hypothetical protein
VAVTWVALVTGFYFCLLGLVAYRHLHTGRQASKEDACTGSVQGRSALSHIWLWLTVTRWFRRVGNWGLVCVMKRSNECTILKESSLIANDAEISRNGGGV